jgi:hypothetical protein
MNKNKKNPDTEHVLQMAAKFEPKSVRLMSMEEYEAEFCNKPPPANTQTGPAQVG